MEVILGFLLAYIGVKLIRNSNKDLQRIRKYMCFKFWYPETMTLKEFRNYIRVLTTYDFPEVPDDNKLEYIVARMRTLDFPEGIRVEYRGAVLEV